MWKCGRASCVVVVLAGIATLAVVAYFVLYLLPTSSATSATIGTRVSATLQFVVVISRDGNKRPFTSYPTDPYGSQDWHCDSGEVTNYGKTQMYNLGVKIRSLYNIFLSEYYSRNEFRASSTAADQTLMSGEAFLAGLYPPIDFQIWNKSMLWQPIPLYSDSATNIDLLIDFCPRLQHERNLSTTEYLKQNAAVIVPLEQYLRNTTGENETNTIEFINNVYDTLMSEEIEGLNLPEWSKKVYPDPLYDLSGKMFIAYSSGTQDMTKLVIGKYFRGILRTMLDKTNKTMDPDRKMYYLSDFDFTLISLQAALGIPKPSLIANVDPSSALILELHQDSNTLTYFIQVLYINGSSTDLEPVPVDIPNCTFPCSFDQLLNITSKFWNFTDYKKLCQFNKSLDLNL